MKLEVVVSAKQANPVYNDGLPRNGQGKMDDSLDNPDGWNMDDRSKVECKTEDDCDTLVTEMEEDIDRDGEKGGRCSSACKNGHCEVWCTIRGMTARP